MIPTWLCVLALAFTAQGASRIRRHNYDGHGSSHLASVPLTHTSLSNNVAICKLETAAGHSVAGDIVFRQTNSQDPVEITGMITGLEPGLHGFHVHREANLGNNCKDAGPHFNPDNHKHGSPLDLERHAGDLGNIPVNEHGISSFQIFDGHVSLFDGHPRQILGRSIVVHQKEDDLGKGGNEESAKTGNAGARVACCIIQPVPLSQIPV